MAQPVSLTWGNDRCSTRSKATAGKVYSEFSLPGGSPLARVALYLADKNNLDDLFGAACG